MTMNNKATMAIIVKIVIPAQTIRHLYLSQKMNLNDFQGDESQKNDVAGRLENNILIIMSFIKRYV